MERAREDGGEPPREDEHASADDAHHGRVHHIHIQRHADGVRVHVHHHGPGSDDEHPAPSGHWSTHNFDHGDHEAIGHFVASVLAKGHGKPAAAGKAPFRKA